MKQFRLFSARIRISVSKASIPPIGVERRFVAALGELSQRRDDGPNADRKFCHGDDKEAVSVDRGKANS